VNSLSPLATKTILFCQNWQKVFICSLWAVFSGFWAFFRYFDVKSTVYFICKSMNKCIDMNRYSVVCAILQCSE
jgi:hypothetical protein